MPKRTNEFQELVTLVQQALAPVGAKVTPSALVDVPGQSSQREIDVLIESNVGPYTIKIAVEAKDESRKMDQTRFEQILAKYQSEGSIKVNKLVIVTHHGFYETVIERAALLGPQVELLTYSQAEATDWAALFPETIRFRVAPHLCKIEFTPEVAGFDEKRLKRDARIICCHGTDYGTPERYVEMIFRKRILPERPNLFQELEQKALAEPNGQAVANVSYKLNHTHSLLIEDQTFPLERISFSIHVISATAPMRYHGCQISSTDGQSAVIPLAEAIVGGKRLQFVMPDGLQSKHIVLRVDSEHPTAEDRRNLRKKRRKQSKKKA